MGSLKYDIVCYSSGRAVSMIRGHRRPRGRFLQGWAAATQQDSVRNHHRANREGVVRDAKIHSPRLIADHHRAGRQRRRSRRGAAISPRARQPLRRMNRASPS